MFGADPEQLDNAARGFNDAAVQFHEIGQSLQRSLSSTPWAGTDAEAFAQRWTTYRASLVGASQILESLSERMAAQANEQRQASASTGSSSTFAATHGHPANTDSPDTSSAKWRDEKTSFDVSSYMERINKIPHGSFEVIQISAHPPKYAVMLPGIETSLEHPLSNDTKRDLNAAMPARLFGTEHDLYAQRVEQELQRLGVPVGAEVMLVGHSYGAIAAMNIASDTSFNATGTDASHGYHVNITHVITGGAGLRDMLDAPPAHTKVLMTINRFDGAAETIQEVREPTHFTTSDSRIIHEFNARGGIVGHDVHAYTKALASADGAADRFETDVMRSYFKGNPVSHSTYIAVPDVH